MRRLRYNVAMSLDGFIAGPAGEYDWIVRDRSVDFGALYRQFDTVLMGRGTFELVLRQGNGGRMPGMDVIVVSSTLRPSEYPGVQIVATDLAAYIGELKSRPGKDIWLFGGGALFRSLVDARVVDAVELAVMPVLLGAGIPVLPPGGAVSDLKLTDSRSLPSGIVRLTYSLERGTQR